MRHIEIFDTTLRDGEQAPGAILGAAEKRRMAQVLADLGVDTIEAGFPAASDEELATVQGEAREVRGAAIAAHERTNPREADAAARAVSPATRTQTHAVI